MPRNFNECPEYNTFLSYFNEDENPSYEDFANGFAAAIDAFINMYQEEVEGENFIDQETVDNLKNYAEFFRLGAELSTMDDENRELNLQNLIDAFFALGLFTAQNDSFLAFCTEVLLPGLLEFKDRTQTLFLSLKINIDSEQLFNFEYAIDGIVEYINETLPALLKAYENALYVINITEKVNGLVRVIKAGQDPDILQQAHKDIKTYKGLLRNIKTDIHVPMLNETLMPFAQERLHDILGFIEGKEIVIKSGMETMLAWAAEQKGKLAQALITLDRRVQRALGKEKNKPSFQTIARRRSEAAEELAAEVEEFEEEEQENMLHIYGLPFFSSANLTSSIDIFDLRASVIAGIEEELKHMAPEGEEQEPPAIPGEDNDVEEEQEDQDAEKEEPEEEEEQEDKGAEEVEPEEEEEEEQADQDDAEEEQERQDDAKKEEPEEEENRWTLIDCVREAANQHKLHSTSNKARKAEIAQWVEDWAELNEDELAEKIYELFEKGHGGWSENSFKSQVAWHVFNKLDGVGLKTKQNDILDQAPIKGERIRSHCNSWFHGKKAVAQLCDAFAAEFPAAKPVDEDIREMNPQDGPVMG